MNYLRTSHFKIFNVAKYFLKRREVIMVFIFFRKKREERYEHHKKAGLSLWSRGDKESAASELEKALKAKPDCIDTWCKLGDLFSALSSDKMLENKLDECEDFRQKSISSLNQAIKIQPDFAEAHYILGNVLWAVDFRKAQAEFERAAKYDSKYENSVAHAKRVISECTYKLGDLKTVYLNSLREEPLPQMYNYEFYFDGDPVKCVVIYGCYSGTKRQWMDAWLFNTEKPNLFQDEPIGYLNLSSTGDISVSKGSPFNYRLILEKLYKERLL